MIDLTIHRQALDRNIQKARESGVVIPTFENMKHPETVPEPIRARLRGVGLWDVDPLNLFRITIDVDIINLFFRRLTLLNR